MLACLIDISNLTLINVHHIVSPALLIVFDNMKDLASSVVLSRHFLFLRMISREKLHQLSNKMYFKKIKINK